VDKYSTCVECKARLPFEHLSKNSMCRDCLLLNSEGRSHRIVSKHKWNDMMRDILHGEWPTLKPRNAEENKEILEQASKIKLGSLHTGIRARRIYDG